MTQDDQNPFDGFSEEDGDDAVWTAVVVMIALLVLALWCWILT